MQIEITVEIGKNEHDYHPVKSKSTLSVASVSSAVLSELVHAMVVDVLNKHRETLTGQEAKRSEQEAPPELATSPGNPEEVF